MCLTKINLELKDGFQFFLYLNLNFQIILPLLREESLEKRKLDFKFVSNRFRYPRSDIIYNNKIIF